MSTSSNMDFSAQDRQNSQTDAVDAEDSKANNKDDFSASTVGLDEGMNDNIDLEKGSTGELLSDRGGPAGPPPPAQTKDPNLIEWDGPNDPGNPMNFSVQKKWLLTGVMGSMTWTITFASSVFSTASLVVAKKYNVSTEVATLGTSLFVVGLGLGPIVWGPASELFGRKTPLFFGFFVFGIFQIGVAVAQNLYTIMLCRFFSGMFGSAPLAIVGGTLADFWGPVDRGVATCVFASATFVGPIAGPVMGSFITASSLGWKWTAWMTMIMCFFFGIVGFIIVPETSHLKILQQRAKTLRFEQKNWAIHSKADETKADLGAFVQTYLIKPFAMLFKEPILVLITLYMALIYGILYLFFEAYPISFQENRHWNSGVASLPFLAILSGVLIGAGAVAYITKTRFARKLQEQGKLVPEERLPPMIAGAFILPIGLFWFAWTSNKDIHWAPQVIAGIPIGCGILMIFLQGMNYVVDVYLWNANSALAGNTLIRSFVGAAFPLFAVQMYHALGVDWASSLLGFLCIALLPVPILFYKYGARIRAASQFSPKM
ncbi:probable fluconazole resistance protein [Phialocephala subalpina]|uniref:Probable fluconazole resistance protein n=1 Tax=Phialocephala subalpina TaxID=576137 RepID=A0A1L7X0E7_9HELO|nr:probable fluconazole resistance protein [Phialocephala subalpina]